MVSFTFGKLFLNGERIFMSESLNYTIKELPEKNRPYEKCASYGAPVLTDRELLAVFLRTGTKNLNCEQMAGRVLESLPGHTLGGIMKVNEEDLKSIKGIGKVKSLQITCLAELVKRIMRCRITENLDCFDSPEAVASVYMNEMRYRDTEEVILLLLNGRNCLIREVIISQGTSDSSFVTPGEVYYNALKYRAAGIILLHNHPTGDPSPSQADLSITKRLMDVGELTGIPFLDHIIIGDNVFFSMKSEGVI